jgi:hypothetical protein
MNFYIVALFSVLIMTILTFLKIRSSTELGNLSNKPLKRWLLLFFESAWALLFLFPLIWLYLNKELISKNFTLTSIVYYLLFLSPTFYILWKNKDKLSHSIRSNR